MARTDTIVLGAGIVGTSIALHLAKRGASVALIERAGLANRPPIGNAGIIEGNTVFPPAFPSDLGALMRIALNQAPEANYHLSFLPQIAPWLLRFRAASRPRRLEENARLIRPLYARAIAEHEALMAESGGAHFLRKNGWLKLYRSEASFKALQREFDMAAQLDIPAACLGRCRRAGARAIAQRGVRARGVLAAGGERERPARRDARLCRALYRARRRDGERRRALAAPAGQPLAGGDRRRRGRRARSRGRARSLGGRSADGPRAEAAAGDQARLSPAFPQRRAMPRWRARCSMPTPAT